MTFLNANEILHERQLGFIHNHSTTRAPSAITEKIRQTCDPGNFACGLFLDLQKGFDTVNHDIQQYTTILFLRTIYHSIFNSHLIYACEIWVPNQTNYYFKKLLHLQEKALRIIAFKLQTSPSDSIFKENKILEISDFVNYKYALFVRKSLRRENVVSFNNIFTPLNLNHNHSTRASINHLLDIPQKQTCHYGTYSIVFTASKVWNDILRKSNKDLLYCEFSAFKKILHFKDFSASMAIITELIELYFVKLQVIVIVKIVHFVFFYQ